MLDTAQPFNLTAFVRWTGEEVVATLTDRRPEGIALFGDLNDEQRIDLASEAWRIGLRALGNAHVAAQESRLKDVGAALVTEIDRQLHAHVEQQQEAIAGTLARFFDPKDGQVSQRLAAFVDDQGVLARLLDKYIGPKNSVLVEVMARQIGESSPLFKKLSATDSEGLVKILERQLGHVMSESRSELVRALDPLAEDGAVARFLRSLREELKGAEQGRAEQLSAALAALQGSAAIPDESDARAARSARHRNLSELCVADRRSERHPAGIPPGGSPSARFLEMVEAKVSAQRPQGRFARHVSKRLAVPMLLVVCIKGELQTSGVWVKRLDKPGPWRQMHLYEYEQRLAKLYNRARPGV